jgi:hypothetical protein
MLETHRPLAQGIIYLCEELIRQNDLYPEEFQAEVATVDVVEQEVMGQIQEIDKLIQEMEAIETPLVRGNSSIVILENMKHKLEDKLNRLHTFNSSTSNNYERAMELAHSIARGLAELQNGNGFNKESGTFSTEGMNLDWIDRIDEIHYTRKAKEQYAEYLNEHPNELDKVIEILKYEDQNPDHKQKTDEFLSPLEQRDVVEIKHLMYSAEEPYRTITLEYLDEFEISSTTESGVFSPSDNTIKFNLEEDRENPRGVYFTLFHEIGHAVDYYHGADQGMDGYFTDSFTIDDKDLTYHMYYDVDNRVRMELEAELDKAEYQDLDEEEKTNMVDNVADDFIYTGLWDASSSLTSEEEDLYEIVQEQISDELYADEHNAASDVYGGVTLNEIVGKWGHHEYDYWVDSLGWRIREPNKEGFAHYYGNMMIENGELRDEKMESVDEYLPESREFMDEIFDSMNEGVNE